MNKTFLKGACGAFLLILLLGVQGCASVKKPFSAADDLAMQQRLYGLDLWRLQGRIAVQTPKDAWSANLFWDHDAHQDRLRISGPFNQGGVSIVLQDDLILIDDGKGATVTSPDPESLLQERLGFAVPLHSLRYWVLGVPSPDTEFSLGKTGDGDEHGFRQQGWDLAYQRFTSVGEVVLPEKATIRGEEVKLKLIASEWVIGK